MRLHKLEITAFGPFADTVAVDFDVLGADGLFLLHGQTGAGKTTVLDAVAFALYGTVPGARRTEKRLLSDHAPQGAVPTVSLEATIGGRWLRIIRNPEYTRSKKRGSGSITENAKATLTWLDGSGENLSRIPDIVTEITQLVGMNADQFFQVVLLPQGEFANFLRADSDARGVLLERLFDTTRFGSVEEWFKTRRKRSDDALAEQLREIESITSKIGAAAGVEGGADADPLRWGQLLCDEAVVARNEASESLTQAKTQAGAARAELALARRLHELTARRDRAQAELARIDSTRDVRAGLIAEAAAARRAQPVAQVETDAARLRRQARVELLQVEEVAASLAAVPGASELVGALSWPPTEQSRAQIRTAVRGWQDETVRLDDAVQQANEAQVLHGQVRELALRRTTLTRELGEIDDALALAPVSVERARVQLDAAEKAAAHLPGLERARDQAADIAAAVKELAERQREAEHASALVERYRQAWNDKREHWLNLVQRRMDGMASELAALLEDGTPCAVCGATEHPEPAVSGAAPVTEDDEQQAHKQERAAQEAYAAAVDAAAVVTRAVDVLAARAGARDRQGAEDELSTATIEYKRARAEAKEVGVRAAALDDASVELTRLAARRGEIAIEVAGLSEQIDARSTRKTEILARLEGLAGEDASVAVRRARLEQLAEWASTLADARDGAYRSETAAAQQDARVLASACEAGFSSVSQALAAVRGEDRLAAIDDTVSGERAAEAAARATLDEPEIREVAQIAPVDVDAAALRDQDASDAEALAIGVAAEGERRLADIERFVGQLRRALEKIEPVRARHAELAALAEVIAGRGANCRKMSLRSYVLAARLEEVAASASVRLRRMSGGRYEFVHSDEAERNGKRGGLGLDIRDDFTGAVRSAKTLSGGESFLASLSLALGLADVVAAESGGIVLDTMFIDEGFGTLDADTLDSVMGVLDELRDGGRVVGIVSHVDEMRQRIPSRLHVVRGRDGSRLETIAG